MSSPIILVDGQLSDVFWSQTFGGEWGEIAYSIVEASDGGFAFAGYTYSFGAGDYDFWLVKTNVTGKTAWTQTYGGQKRDVAYSLIKTSDGGLALAGYTESFGTAGDFWLVKTDAQGNMLWSQNYGGPNLEKAYSIIETSDGGYVLVGSKRSIGIEDLTYDTWMVKTDREGKAQWNKTFGGANNDIIYSIVETSDSGYVLGGYTDSVGPVYYSRAWIIKTDLSGNMIWNQTIWQGVAYSLISTSDGGFAFTGSNSFIYPHMWVVKTNSTGHMEWQKAYFDDNGRSIIQTPDGGYAVAGQIETQGRKNYRLIKTDSLGNEMWNQTYGTAENDETVYSLIQTSDGGYALAGYRSYDKYNSKAGWLDAWVVKTDENGTDPEQSTPFSAASFSSFLNSNLFSTASAISDAIPLALSLIAVSIGMLGALLFNRRNKHKENRESSRLC